MTPRQIGLVVGLGLLLGLAFMLAGCGESEPAPPTKRASLDDITNAAARLMRPKAAPAPQAEPVPLPEPPPIAARPVEAVPAPQLATTPLPAVKPKAKPQQWKKRKPVKNGSVAGYSCSTIRMAGSAANVEQMASARGYTVSASDSRKIQACFDQR